MVAAFARYKLYLAVVKTIAEACGSTGVIYATNMHGSWPLILFGNEEQKKRLLPRMAAGGIGSIAITEPSAGSDATGMTTKFTPAGDDVIVDGGKTFITSGSVCDLMLLFGKWSEIADAKGAISALVVEKGTPGFSVTRIEDKMGHRASPTAAVAFDKCRVPRTNLLGAPGDGINILLTALNRSRPSIAAHALGIATAAFKDMVAYMNTRRQSGRRIAEFQGNQFMLADLASELAMAEAWLDHVADLVDSGAADFSVEASIAKLRCERSCHAHDHRGGADARRLRLLPRLSRRAADARRQGDADMGGHQSGTPPVDRPELCATMTLTAQRR